MSRVLLIDIPVFSDAQRKAIEAAARERGFDVTYDSNDAAEAEVIFCANAKLVAQAPKLKWLCVPSAGTDQYLKPVLEDREGVMLSNSSGAYGVTIAEHTVMVTLMLMRRELEYAALVAQRGWRRDLPIRSIRGCRAALLGTGDIGREVATRLRAFGAKSIVGVNRRGRSPGEMFDAAYPIDRLDDVLPETDLLIMSLPGTPETRGIMDDRRFRLLPDDAFIVNVGRGAAIDEAALAKQLHEGRFAGVALDVFTHEPLSAEDPLWDCPRLLITPHVAGNMTLAYTRQRIVELFLEDFARYCNGQPLQRGVELKQGY